MQAVFVAHPKPVSDTFAVCESRRFERFDTLDHVVLIEPDSECGEHVVGSIRIPDSPRRHPTEVDLGVKEVANPGQILRRDSPAERSCDGFRHALQCATESLSPDPDANPPERGTHPSKAGIRPRTSVYTFDLRPLDGGTDVTFHIEFPPMKGMNAVMVPLLFPIVAKPDFRKRLAQLKQKVESPG